jgi:hypothetical protein
MANTANVIEEMDFMNAIEKERYKKDVERRLKELEIILWFLNSEENVIEGQKGVILIENRTVKKSSRSVVF